jgi:D-alanine-D-alanine ligase
LEVNANPCLSPDAGFPAAIEKAGISYSDMIGMFVDFLKLRSEQDLETSKGLGKRGEDTVFL